jgi:hypothetical protein
MAQAFSTKNYFKKIYSHELLTEFYKRHNIVAIFEITDQTARKSFLTIINDFYASLSPSEKIEIEKELALVNSISTKYAPPLFSSLIKEQGIPNEETEIECTSDHDKVLYRYMFNREIFDEVLFFHDFYSSRGYMLYEAKNVDLVVADLAMTELKKEFTRIINKEERATECDFTYKTLDGVLYLTTIFDGAAVLSAKKDAATGEVDRTRTVKKLEEIKIVYLPEDEEVLISYTGSKYEKLIFLDTFLRIVCKSGYEGKEESFNLTPFSDETFDFTKTNKGVPLLTWKIKSITLSFGSEKTKKKMRLTLPSSVHEYGLVPLYSTLEELALASQIKNYTIENVALVFSFINALKVDKSILVPCSLSKGKSSLCPLFPYDRLARTLLKQAHIEEGFVKQVKKETEDMTKKWEL